MINHELIRYKDTIEVALPLNISEGEISQDENGEISCVARIGRATLAGSYSEIEPLGNIIGEIMGTTKLVFVPVVPYESPHYFIIDAVELAIDSTFKTSKKHFFECLEKSLHIRKSGLPYGESAEFELPTKFLAVIGAKAWELYNEGIFHREWYPIFEMAFSDVGNSIARELKLKE